MSYVLLGPTKDQSMLRDLMQRVNARRTSRSDIRAGTLSDAKEGETVVMLVADHAALGEAVHHMKHGFDGHQTVVLVSVHGAEARLPRFCPVNVKKLCVTIEPDASNLDVVADMFIANERLPAIADDAAA